MNYSIKSYIGACLYIFMFFTGIILVLSETHGDNWLMMFLVSRCIGIISLYAGYQGFKRNQVLSDFLESE